MRVHPRAERNGAQPNQSGATSIAQNAACSRAPEAYATSGLHRLDGEAPGSAQSATLEDCWPEEFEEFEYFAEELVSGTGNLGTTSGWPSVLTGDERPSLEQVQQLRSDLAGLQLEMACMRKLLEEKDALIARLAPPPPLVRSVAGGASVRTSPTMPAAFATDVLVVINDAGRTPEAPTPASTAPEPAVCRAHRPSELAAADSGPPVFRQLSIHSRADVDSLPPPDSQAAERRSQPRLMHELHVEFVAESHFFAGLTQDISSGGLFVATYQVLPLGTKLGMKLELPDGSELEAEGVVRWGRAATHEGEPPGIGIAFTDLSPDNLARITSFCEQRPPLYMEL